MEIVNQKVYFLGDSITAGVGASVPEKSFVRLFANKYPQATVINYGISGTRIAKKTVPSENPYCDQDFIDRVEQMEDGADLVVIFGGTNDYGHGDAPIGKFGDTDPYTFYGGARTLFEKLLFKFPKARLLVLTPLHRIKELNENAQGDVFYKFIVALRETAELFSIPVLDLYAVSGINPNFGNLKEEYMTDGLHPNDAGHQRVFDLIDAYIKHSL